MTSCTIDERQIFRRHQILLYAHDRSAGLKRERARKLVEDLWTTGQGVLSPQVLQIVR